MTPYRLILIDSMLSLFVKLDKKVKIGYNIIEGVSQPKMGNLSRELLLALSKTFKSERFAALRTNITKNKLPDRIDFCQVVSV